MRRNSWMKHRIGNRKGILGVALFAAALFFFIFQSGKTIETVQTNVLLYEKQKKIIIDAGHGGEDGGAVGVNGALEKDINLAIAQEIYRLLDNQGFDVVMVRDSDAWLADDSLNSIAKRKRSDMVNRMDLIQSYGQDCIFVSIHQNHFSQEKYSGAQVFYSKNHKDSAALAEAIRTSVITELQPENNRQNKEAEENIFLLNQCKVPAVLVECGFLSNAKENEQLCDETYQKQMARAVAQGIYSYFLTPAPTASPQA